MAVQSSSNFVEFKRIETGCTIRVSLSFRDWAWVMIFGQTETTREYIRKALVNGCYWDIYATVRVNKLLYND